MDKDKTVINFTSKPQTSIVLPLTPEGNTLFKVLPRKPEPLPERVLDTHRLEVSFDRGRRR